MALVIPGTISKWQPGQEARRGAGSRGGGARRTRGVMTLGGPISFNKTKERPTPARPQRYTALCTQTDTNNDYYNREAEQTTELSLLVNKFYLYLPTLKVFILSFRI